MSNTIASHNPRITPARKWTNKWTNFAHQRNCLTTKTKGTFCGLQFPLQNYFFVCLTIICKIQRWTLHYLHDRMTWKLQLEKIFQSWRIYFISIYFVFSLFLVFFVTTFLFVCFDFSSINFIIIFIITIIIIITTIIITMLLSILQIL